MDDFTLIPVPIETEASADWQAEGYINPKSVSYCYTVRKPDGTVFGVVYTFSGSMLSVPIEIFRQVVEYAHIPKTPVPRAFFTSWPELGDDNQPLDKS